MTNVLTSGKKSPISPFNVTATKLNSSAYNKTFRDSHFNNGMGGNIMMGDLSVAYLS
jgi:hypothetical protein